jgi:hypothetical protein
MKKIKLVILVIIPFLGITSIKAQQRFPDIKKQSYTDSLFSEISGTVYNAFYTPSFMGNKTPTSAFLKIDIDDQGKVSDIRFSDSADSLFVKAWTNRKIIHDDKATLERYAKVKGYKDLSLLMQVNFEPGYPNSNNLFSYGYIEAMMKFNKKLFIGNSVMLRQTNIRILPYGNM